MKFLFFNRNTLALLLQRIWNLLLVIKLALNQMWPAWPTNSSELNRPTNRLFPPTLQKWNDILFYTKTRIEVFASSSPLLISIKAEPNQ